MNLGRALLASLLLAAFAAAAPARPKASEFRDGGKKEGKHPDLSGTWALDKSRSNYGEARGRDISKADSTLVIGHRGAELSIERTVVLKGQRETKHYAYYTDGRGESNPMAYGSGTFETQTKWDGAKVVARTPARRGSASESTQTWELSADGQTLTHTTVSGSQEFNWGDSHVSPWNSVKIKLVYRRAG
jgi:hypothetical protein